MLSPSYAITRGQPPAGGFPEGNVMVGENVMELPPWLAVMASVPLVPDWVNFAVTDSGLPGRAPDS